MTVDGGRRRTYLIQDPYDLDAVEFIRTIDSYFGLRPVCFYTSPKDRYYGERRFPILTSDVIEATYDVDLDDLASFASDVGNRFDVVAVIPYREDTVEVAAELLELLDVGWVEPETLRRFRDKFALKTHIRRIDPDVRLPEARLIESVADLDRAPLPEQFVIKPNSGFGNRSIGIFSALEGAAARAHVSSEDEQTWILEEYVGGIEYHIDGQVRSGGAVTPLAVFEYTRAEVNQYKTVYLGEIQCATHEPVFGPLIDYATRILAATGLERCPFHMEVKVDGRGPCMIDLGARFPSEGGGKSLTRLHPNRPGAFVVAAHDYFSENRFATEPVDWTVYDQQRTVLVYGVSDRNEMIEVMSGFDAVEARPEFVRWLVRPDVGDRVEVTTDLRGAPYIVELSCNGDRDAAMALINDVRATISWNDRSGRRSAANARLRNLIPRVARKARWIGRSAAMRFVADR